MGLNAGKVKAPANTGNYQVIEQGNYPARLVQVIDLGLQAQRPYQGQEKPPAHEVMLTYELVNEFAKDDEGNDMTDKPRWISETMPLRSLESDLATSTKRIKVFDPTLASGGDLVRLLSSPCMVAVVHKPHKTDKDKVYTNIGNVTPPMKGFPMPELVNEPKAFDLTEPDLEIFGSLPDWLQGKIKENLEYNGSQLQVLLEGDKPATTAAPAQEPEEDAGTDSPY